MSAPAKAPRKWRPSVGLVVALVLAAALSLPLAGLFFFRIYENQLIRETEAELIAQSAALAAAMAREIEAGAVPAGALGPAAPRDVDPSASQDVGRSRREAGPYRPIPPTLDLTTDSLLGRRPEAAPAPAPPDPAYVALGARLAPDLVATQQVTLAGFRLLDPRGVVIAGGAETGQSLAHVEEVAAGLAGRFASVMRLRVSRHAPPPLYSWSRGTSVRVFTAMPVIAQGRLAGLVYASRTPSNVFRSLYAERGKVAAAAATILTLALAIGLIFHRTIARPMRDLMARTAAIGRGERAALAPLAHHGTAEFAQLSQSFLDMARALQNRSDFIATFAAHVSHELKSPLTAIRGAAELMRDDLDAPGPAMREVERRRFLDNIVADAGRLAALVERLRDLARAEAAPTSGETTLRAATTALASGIAKLRIEARGALDERVAMSPDNARIVLANLADNAAKHGAKALTIDAARAAAALRVVVADDGDGVSPANRDRVFDSFFTTRRDSGGTGMGLAIVRAMLEAHGGSIRLEDAAGGRGAVFVLTIPLWAS